MIINLADGFAHNFLAAYNAESFTIAKPSLTSVTHIPSCPVNSINFGAMGEKSDSPVKAELDAVQRALEICRARKWNPINIYSDCPGVQHMANNFQHCVSWRFQQEVQDLKKSMAFFPNMMIAIIKREDNNLANALADYGRLNPQLSLFG